MVCSIHLQQKLSQTQTIVHEAVSSFMRQKSRRTVIVSRWLTIAIVPSASQETSAPAALCADTLS